MRALSIRQPYAWAIIAGLKPVENRTWYSGYRGPLAIHAGVSWYDGRKNGEEDMLRWARQAGLEPPPSLLGGIIGVVDMIDCVKDHPSDWFFGPYGFVLANPRPVPFVPIKGRLGFFDVDDALLRVVR